MNSLEKQTRWSFAFPSTLCLNPSLKKKKKKEKEQSKTLPTNKTDFNIICPNPLQFFEAGCDKTNKWKRLICKMFVTIDHIKTTAWKTHNYMNKVAFQKTSVGNQVHCIMKKTCRNLALKVFSRNSVYETLLTALTSSSCRRSDTKCKESFGPISQSQVLCAKRANQRCKAQKPLSFISSLSKWIWCCWTVQKAALSCYCQHVRAHLGVCTV